MKRVVSLIIILLIISTNIVFSAEENIEEGLTSVLIGDYDSGDILYEFNVDKKIEIASITKLMTYLVTMDMISNGDISIEDTVEVGINPTKVGGSTFKLYKGEKVKLKTLLDAIIIASGNDACVALAEHIAGNEKEFVNLMNNKAKLLGLDSAVYYNSSGMPVTTQEGKKIQNIMSVKDIFKLCKYIIFKHPSILEISNRTEIDIPEREYFKENTNPLLKEISLVDGLKTGYTDKAGYCLISTLKISGKTEIEEDFRVISIAMGAKSEESRKIRNKEIINYIIKNYTKRKILSKDKSEFVIDIYNAVNQNVKVFPKEDMNKILKLGDEITTEVKVDKDLIAPLKSNQRVGIIRIFKNNNKIKEIDLIVKREVKKANFFTRFLRSLQNFILKVRIEGYLTK